MSQPIQPMDLLQSYLAQLTNGGDQPNYSMDPTTQGNGLGSSMSQLLANAIAPPTQQQQYQPPPSQFNQMPQTQSQGQSAFQMPSSNSMPFGSTINNPYQNSGQWG